jgi:hypothetical protein
MFGQIIHSPLKLFVSGSFTDFVVENSDHMEKEIIVMTDYRTDNEIFCINCIRRFFTSDHINYDDILTYLSKRCITGKLVCQSFLEENSGDGYLAYPDNWAKMIDL